MEERCPALPDPDPVDDLEQRLAAVFGSSGARLLEVLRQFGRAAGLDDPTVRNRIRAGVRQADQRIAAGCWGGVPAVEFARLFRSRKWCCRKRVYQGRTALASRERLLVAAAVHLALREDPNAPDFAVRLEEDVRARVRAARALLDPQAYLAEFEAIYGPRERQSGDWDEPGLIGAVAIRRASALVLGNTDAMRALAVDLTADAQNHLGDYAAGVQARFASGRPAGLPVPDGPPELPLRYWVRTTASNRMSRFLVGRERTLGDSSADVEAATAFARGLIHEACIEPIGDRILTLSPSEFNQFGIDRFLAPRSMATDAGQKRHGDGRDEVIADILGISVQAVYNNRKRYKKRLRDPDGRAWGEER